MQDRTLKILRDACYTVAEYALRANYERAYTNVDEDTRQMMRTAMDAMGTLFRRIEEFDAMDDAAKEAVRTERSLIRSPRGYRPVGEILVPSSGRDHRASSPSPTPTTTHHRHQQQQQQRKRTPPAATPANDNATSATAAATTADAAAADPSEEPGVGEKPLMVEAEVEQEKTKENGPLIVDVQMLVAQLGTFVVPAAGGSNASAGGNVIKEFAAFEVGETVPVMHVLVKSPTEARPEVVCNRYVIANVHGIRWEDGDVEYEEFLRRARLLLRGRVVYVRGPEKKRTLEALFPCVEAVHEPVECSGSVKQESIRSWLARYPAGNPNVYVCGFHLERDYGRYRCAASTAGALAVLEYFQA